MKKSRLVFYLIFALFHIGAFVFTVVLGNDTGFLMGMFKWIPYFKWVTLFGIVMVLIDFIWAWIAGKDRDREKEALAHEVNTLKAKLFDMQEDVARKASAPQPPVDPPATQQP